MTGLALFDIDGTLTQSNEIDTDCFVGAFADEFGESGRPGRARQRKRSWRGIERDLSQGCANGLTKSFRSAER